MDAALRRNFAALGTGSAQTQTLKDQFLALQASLHLTLVKRDALNGRTNGQLIGIQAPLPLRLAAGTGQVKLGIQSALHAPAWWCQNRPSADLRQPGFDQTTQGRLGGPLPALRRAAERAEHLRLRLAHLFAVPLQIGLQTFVVHLQHQAGLAQTRCGGLTR